MSLRLSYGSNGFTDHSLPDALAIIADLGYEGVAITLDHQHLDPFASDLNGRIDVIARLLERYGLSTAIETGARYLLDPWHKHEPTMVSTNGQERRIKLIHRAIDIAVDLGTDVVHLWSGALPADVSTESGWDRLLVSMAQVLPRAEAAGVRLAFEPEPGMLVQGLADYEQLRDRLGAPSALYVTVDVGHLLCTEKEPPEIGIRRVATDIAHVQIEDMRRGVHEHLEFGEGDLDLDAVMVALLEIGYTDLVSVELGRHSANAPVVAARSIDALRVAANAARHHVLSPTTEETP